MTKYLLLSFLLTAILCFLFMQISEKETVFLPKNEIKIDDIQLDEIRCGRGKISVRFEAPGKMKVTISSFVTKEMEIAADDDIFWFWSRSFDENSVYYCATDKIAETRVRPFLYPFVLRSLILAEDGNQESDGIKRVTDVTEQRLRRHVFYKKEQPILTVLFLSFQKCENFVLPKKVRVTIHEEEMSFDLDIGKARLNTGETVDTKFPEGLSRVNLDSY